MRKSAVGKRKLRIRNAGEAVRLIRVMKPRNDPAGRRRRMQKDVPEARFKGGGIARKREMALEENRAHRASIGLPPLQRVKRAPGEINPRRGKGGGLNRQGKMIE